MSWDWQNSNVDRYGGVSDKSASGEGKNPHAYGIYRFLQNAQGSAYSKELSGLLHAENLAEARQGAAAMRAAEKLKNNSFPSRADESLQYWVDVTGVRVGEFDSDEDIRRKCQARYQSFNGNDAVNVQTAVRTILGDAFVSIERNGGGALDEPSLHTYWPGVNPGPVAHDLGGGAWFSDNAHILVVVNERGALNLAQIRSVIAIDLVDLLDDMLPAWVTFESTKNEGFFVGVSPLDETTVCEA